MAKDPAAADYTIGIIGAGAMGRGIAQIMAAGGVKVLLFDTNRDACDDAASFIGRMLGRAAEKGNMTAEDSAAAVARITIAGALSDMEGADLVVEAIIEDLDIKRALFRDLEAIVGAECILVTNTSSLSVTAIAAGLEHPERVAGYHFFNPVPLLRLVEVVDGLMTAPWVADNLVKLSRRAGHEPVRVKDSPGFLVNHAGRGLSTEGLRIVAEGIAGFQDVDEVLREGGTSFRMGPFELMDTTGLDVSHVVMESIYQQFHQEPRFRPQPMTRQRVAAGIFGRKTGRGFYPYEEGKKITATPPPPPQDLPGRVWISPADEDGRRMLTEALDGKIELDNAKAPSVQSICLLTPVGEDCTTAAVRQGIEAERCFAIDTMFGLDGRRTLMTNPVADANLRDQIHALLAADGNAVTVIHDSPGFINQRVVATIVNIACDIAQQRIAAPADIDKAVHLGLGYPKGPLAMGDAVGGKRILAVLDGMYSVYGDPRYRPSPWLRRRALLGMSLLTPEG
ncbi:MAG: 3-hydroxyacyl-CoA dehydrogenase [Alphaproteobacteria bacterium]